MPIHTLGHSTHTQQDFIESCQAANIHTIIDTRSHPGSANYPHYNRENMSIWLPAAGINYEWWPNLGGWDKRHANLTEILKPYDVDLTYYTNGHFPKQRIAKKITLEEGKPGWTNYGFHDYQFYTAQQEFLDACASLVQRTNENPEENTALICCEACWTRCHRAMIADYLTHTGTPVTHLTPRFRKIKQPRTVITKQPHNPEPRLPRYHPDVLKAWHQRQQCKKPPTP